MLCTYIAVYVRTLLCTYMAFIGQSGTTLHPDAHARTWHAPIALHCYDRIQDMKNAPLLHTPGPLGDYDTALARGFLYI